MTFKSYLQHCKLLFESLCLVISLIYKKLRRFSKLVMRILILYGSQTGTAQDVAEQLWRASKRHNFHGPVMAMDDYPIQKLIEEHLVLFVVATTGDGEEPDNMRKTWKFLLRRNLPVDSLANLQFACLGLGDSSYIKFNFAAKKLNKRLQQLGAKPIIPLALADDQHDYGLNAVALPWMANLWKELEERLGLNIRCPESSPETFIFKWHCCKLNHASVVDEDYHQLLWPHRQAPTYLFEVKSNTRTTDPSHFQDVRLIQFKITDDVTWLPGDIIEIHPHNSEKQIDDFFALVQEHEFDFDSNTVVRISSNYQDMLLPKCYSKPLSVRQMATYIWDLSAKPRQRVFELLALNCEDNLEKEKLLEFTTAEGLEEVVNYINRPHRTILEVLQDFRHASSKLTLEILIEMFSVIQSRSFSIASCVESKTLDILVAIVEYKTKMSAPRLGLCSNWLKSLKNGNKILGYLKRGTMQLPEELSTPLIMIGPGTGIAPFRSIIQKHIVNRRDLEPYKSSIWVFFGCRNRLKDYHFQSDLESWHKQNYIKLFVAFSRDQDYKIYVQHLIEKHSQELKKLIKESNAYIYVAGSSKNMPKAVKEAFINILDKDETYVEKICKLNRYQEETWS
uniref:NADPH-dependent diflavin oxidoreductase 1 n=1 Tax=Glossina brevipalpis TaxID=37001 RepID=A0A1A9X523_9MUSC